MSNVNDQNDDVERETDASGAVPQFAPWVTAYGILHRNVERRTALFGGTAVVGAIALVRWCAALVFDLPASGLDSVFCGAGALLFGFGGGYYVVRHESTCSECGTPFSRERTDRRPVQCEVGDRDTTYVEHTYECQHCGHRTTEVQTQPEQSYPPN